MDLLAGLRRSPELLPGLLAVGVFVALAASEGGFEAVAWYPAALFVLGLTVVSVLTLGRRRMLSLDAGARLALLLLTAFTAWAFASITWADVQGDAWDGANRTLLYLLVFALFALLPWRGSAAALVMGAHTVALAALALLTLADLASSSDPVLGLIGGRLSEPTGYSNATAALFLAAFFPALLLASRREIPWWGRGPLLAAAVVLLEVAILPQSRGSLIAFPLVALAFVALAPGRSRLVLVGAPVAVATFLASGPLLDVYPAVRDGGDVLSAFDDAYRAVWISGLTVLAFGLVLGLAERSIEPPERLRRYAGRTVGVVSGAAAIVGVLLALGATGNPVDWLDERWEDFKAGQDTSSQQESRFGGSLGTNRYDFWRVAMDEFGNDPIVGMGMDQFAVDYTRERRSDEEPFNPHSVGVKVISQTGLVGALMFAGFLVAAVAGAINTRRRAGDTLEGAVAAAGLVAFGYWFVHGSGDWFWEFPGLSAPVFAWLAVAGALRPGDEAPRLGFPPIALVIAGVASVLIACSLAFPWGAARDVQIAADHWPANPEGALDRLDRAHDLNPLSAQADVVAGTIAMRTDEPRRAIAAFRDAAERDDTNWYTLLMLGTLEIREGARPVGLAHLRAASALTPRDPLVTQALARTQAGRPLAPEAIDRELRARICVRLGRTEATPFCE